MNILGISALYHDSAAALLQDGEIVAAAQEERFTRIKNDASFPSQTIAWCLGHAGISPAQLDVVTFYEIPSLKWDRIVKTFLATAPSSLPAFLEAVPKWLGEKANVDALIRRELGPTFGGRIECVEHHVSHAASAFYPSPFDEAAILTIDGVGEWATTTMGVGEGNRLTLTDEIRFPHSLGLLYSAFTHYCGFRINSGEYKLMGLAPYGSPTFVDVIYDNLIDVVDDGAFRLNLDYFDFQRGLRTTNEKFFDLFGGPPKHPDALLTQREMDIAASIQVVTEEVVLKLARTAHRKSGKKSLCMAGGVALNCVVNGRLLREGPFDRIWIQPAAGDAGGALGSALFAWHQTENKARTALTGDSMRGALLGPEFDDAAIGAALDELGAVGERLTATEVIEEVSSLLAGGKVVGWFQGRMEYGPRALGARSILADPRDPEMQKVLNLKVKFREGFRPFAPAVLSEHAAEYFGAGGDDPYMLFVRHIASAHRLTVPEAENGLTGIDKLKVSRSDIPAATHVDYSARVQTVDRERHGRYRDVLERFHERTGCPVLLNTSFNVRGEPIVRTPADAYRCFMGTDIDALAIGNYLLLKSRQPSTSGERRHHEQFAFD